MAERLGLGIIPGAGWRAAEIKAVARAAEDAGFDAIFTAEVNSDALATTQLMGEVSQQIKVGTWIAGIHMRRRRSVQEGSLGRNTRRSRPACSSSRRLLYPRTSCRYLPVCP